MALLSPGAHRAAGVVDDAALVAAMLGVEVAWAYALAEVGAVAPAEADAVARAAAGLEVDLDALAHEAEGSGNPVVPLVRRLRAAAGEAAAGAVHRGLTSQDVLDTALVLLARDALARVRDDLDATAEALAGLAEEHRGSVMAGRTLGQHAVPTTFGRKAAGWLGGVLDAADEVDRALAGLPVQCGGAAGTLSLVAELADDPVATAEAFARALDLTWPGAPWHTQRLPVVRLGAALAAACAALGAIATDVVTLSRPEIAELREPAADGPSGLPRGGSSTMPHKRNPVLSVLLRSIALQAPAHVATLHLAAGQAGDERPDGAWHAEWPALRSLAELAVTAASLGAELTAGLEVDADAMRRRAEDAADDLLAEAGVRDGEVTDYPGEVTDYLGATDAIIDAVLARRPDHEGEDSRG